MWPPKSSQGAFIYVTATFNYHQHLYKRRGGKTLIRATSLHLSICIAWSTRCPAILLRTGPSSRLPRWGPCAVPCTGWLERQSSPGYVTSAYVNIACDWHQNPWKVTNGSCSQEDLLALSTHGPYLCLMHSEIWISSHNICMSLHNIEVPGAKPVESEELIFILLCSYMWIHMVSPCIQQSDPALPHTQDPDKEEAPELAIDDMDDEPIIIDVKDPNYACIHMTQYHHGIMFHVGDCGVVLDIMGLWQESAGTADDVFIKDCIYVSSSCGLQSS